MSAESRRMTPRVVLGLPPAWTWVVGAGIGWNPIWHGLTAWSVLGVGLYLTAAAYSWVAAACRRAGVTLPWQPRHGRARR